MEERQNSSYEQVVAEERIEDLEVRENAGDVRGGSRSDPDEGGQVTEGVVSTRLAVNSNETVVEDDS